MKLFVRILALSVVVVGAVAGNSITRAHAASAAVASPSGSVPGPVPLCNPFGKHTCSLR